MKSTFESCNNLEKFNMHGFNLNNLASVNKVFSGTRISNIDMKEFNLEKIEDLSYMFAYLDIEEFNLKGMNTQNVKNMSYMFYGALFKKIELNNLYTKNVIDMSHMFSHCESLTSLNLEGMDESRELELRSEDKWILTKLNKTIKEVTKYMDKYDFNAASSHLYNFVYDDFCSQYLEMSKVTLNGEDLKAKEATYQTLYKALKDIILLIYPYTPFIGEELYQALPEHLESIMLESYPKASKKEINTEHDKEVELLFGIIRDIRNYKIENKLAPNAQLNIKANLKINVFSSFALYLNRFSFSNVEFSNAPLISTSGELLVYDDGDVLIESNQNKDELIATIKHEIEVEENEIKRCNNMLNNPNFLAKAPKEKVDNEKSKLETHLANLASLKEKLEKLK
jgi:valyl-tRNA synthetase